MAIKKNILLGLSAILLLILAGCSDMENDINSFEDCVEAGFPVMESYPEQCSDGKNTFTKQYTNLTDTNGSSNNSDINENKTPNYTVESYCVENDGEWLEEFNECIFISEQVCTAGGGVFSECESACRNDPDAEICTMQCVQVCDFPRGYIPTENNNNDTLQDAYGNVIPNGCSSWFDGCNNCNIGENGSLGCTRKYCPTELLEEPSCLSYD